LQSSFHQKEDYFLFEKRHAKLDQKPTEWQRKWPICDHLHVSWMFSQRTL
jgi:hypothetical protein